MIKSVPQLHTSLRACPEAFQE